MDIEKMKNRSLVNCKIFIFVKFSKLDVKRLTVGKTMNYN